MKYHPIIPCYPLMWTLLHNSSILAVAMHTSVLFFQHLLVVLVILLQLVLLLLLLLLPPLPL